MEERARATVDFITCACPAAILCGAGIGLLSNETRATCLNDKKEPNWTDDLVVVTLDFGRGRREGAD